MPIKAMLNVLEAQRDGAYLYTVELDAVTSTYRINKAVGEHNQMLPHLRHPTIDHYLPSLSDSRFSMPRRN
jgi:hypothetical protein